MIDYDHFNKHTHTVVKSFAFKPRFSHALLPDFCQLHSPPLTL